MRAASGDFDWNDDAVGRLRALCAEGYSTAEIGRRLGISKNAVVGKSDRLDLPARPSPIRRDGVGRAARPRRLRCPRLAKLQSTALSWQPLTPSTAPTAQPAARTPTPISRPKPDVLRPDRTALLSKHPCSWPIGDPGTKDFRFCEDLSEAGRPYCPRHCADAYVDRPKRQKAA